MKMKVTLRLLVVIAGMIFWILFSIKQPPEWAGVSSSGEWQTTFEDEYSPKGFWNGYFSWNGESSVTVSKVILRRNGAEIHGWEQTINMNPNTSYNYLTTTHTFDDREDEYTLTIHWTNKEGQHEETIELFPKTRYFVIPRL